MRRHSVSQTPDILTVDYEDWFHVADRALLDPETWEGLRISVEEDTLQLLDVLDEHDARATFFVVGWLAERTPDTLREVVRRGHRLGVHSYHHVPPNAMSEAEFESDIIRCVQVLEELTGVVPQGYRAPYFGVRDCSFPYLEVLSRCGLAYDSSVYAGFLPGRGQPGAPAVPHEADRRNPALWGIPISATRLCGIPIGFSGGGSLRLLPAWFVRCSCRRSHRCGIPVVYYLHPRDMNPTGPVAPTSSWRRLRYYGRRSSVRRKLETILEENRLTSVEEFLSSVQCPEGSRSADPTLQAPVQRFPHQSANA